MRRETLALEIIDAVMRMVRTSTIGEVVDYDHPSSSATVQPLIRDWRMAGGERQAIEIGSISKVPVLQMGGATRGITMGLDPGDLVLLLHSHSSLDAVKSGGREPAMPASHDRMGSQDLIAIPLMSTPEPGLPSDAVGSGGQPVWMYPAGERVHLGAADAGFDLARADKVDQRISALEQAFTAHTHTVASAVAAVIVPPYTPGSPTASDSIKVRS